jgi:hypothetical protein
MYRVKRYVNGYPEYFQGIDESGNALWCNIAQYSYLFMALYEAQSIAREYNAIVFEVY